MKRWLTLVVFTAVFLTLAGCKSAPIYNIGQTAISSSQDVREIAKAIKGAGASLGWIMKEEAPGKIIGTLFLRSHMAKVAIEYSAKNYSINYLDSTELNYDGAMIHSNYNGWIQNLNRNIQAQLGAL